MPYVIQKRHEGRIYYRAESPVTATTGARVYHPLVKYARTFETQGAARRECVEGERAVILIRILKETY